MKEQLNKEEVEKIINEANQKFGSDFKLVGSWSKPENERKHPPNDIDLFTEKEINVDKSGWWIARQTDMCVDIWYYKCFFKGQGQLCDVNDNYVILPNGEHGTSMDFNYGPCEKYDEPNNP